MDKESIMIRYAFISNQILNVYRNLSDIQFPIMPKLLIEKIPNCKIASYDEFAKISDCSVEEVAALCDSNSGCTHYDKVNDKYLVLYNDSPENNNVSGRIRWTLAHELGHIVLKHLAYLAEPSIAEHNINNISNPELEAEADHFAALLLSPMPLYEQLNVKSASDIYNVFGLSHEASEIRWREYQKWKRSHRKTAWENDMKRLYSQSAANV